MAKAKREPLGNAKGKDRKIIAAMQKESARFTAQAEVKQKGDKEQKLYDHAYRQAYQVAITRQAQADALRDAKAKAKPRRKPR